MGAVRNEQVSAVVQGKALRVEQKSVLQRAQVAYAGRARYRLDRKSG